MNYDPKLREAMDEFRALCRKYDIGAYVCFASKTHMEFGLEIDTPSWSHLKRIPNGIRFKSPAAEKEKREATVAMAYGFRDMMTNGFATMHKLCEMMQEHLAIEHTSMVGKAPDSVPGDDAN